jgi:hypothetical protein
MRQIGRLQCSKYLRLVLSVVSVAVSLSALIYSEWTWTVAARVRADEFLSHAGDREDTSRSEDLNTGHDAPHNNLSETARSARPVTHAFVVIKTVPLATRRRNVLRATWLPMLGAGNMTYRFFSEKPPEDGLASLQQEVLTHRDVVVLDIEVMQHRKVGPKMIESFRWIDQHWDCQFVVVTDDDTYVFPPTMFRDIPTWSGPMLYLGYQMDGMTVMHVPPGQRKSKKYGERNYPAKYFPRYCSGIYFVLSVDALQTFVRPLSPLRVMTSNDAQVGTVLLPYNVKYETRRGVFPWGHKNTSLCIKPESFYAIHITPEYLTSWHEYESTVLGLHRNLTAGACIRGFSASKQ